MKGHVQDWGPNLQEARWKRAGSASQESRDLEQKVEKRWVPERLGQEAPFSRQAGRPLPLRIMS